MDDERMDDPGMARGLAWFGIGLGVLELLAPSRVARWTGLKGHEGTIRLFGLREVASGAVVLASPDPARALGVRVAGDVLDASLLGAGLLRPGRARRRAALATAAVAPVVALDLAVWLSARDSRPRRGTA